MKYTHHILSLLLISLSATAAPNTSSEPVGVLHVEVPTNSSVLIALPFHPFDGDIQALIGDQLTGKTNELNADLIQKWDVVLQQYTNAYLAGETGGSQDGIWFSDFATWTTSTLSFAIGDGFFVASRQSVTQHLYLAGEVPLNATNTVSLSSGLSLFGYPFIATLPLNSSDLLSDGAIGASVQTNADQVTDTLNSDIYWLLNDSGSPHHLKWLLGTNLSNFALKPGEGYWYQHQGTNALSWSEARPYANPFVVSTNPPSVTGVAVDAGGSNVTLSISTTGATNETLDVLYQDVSRTSSMQVVTWSIAATNIATLGQTSTNWTGRRFRWQGHH